MIELTEAKAWFKRTDPFMWVIVPVMVALLMGGMFLWSAHFSAVAAAREDIRSMTAEAKVATRMATERPTAP